MSFGQLNGVSASFGEASFSGMLDVSPIPEPATSALWLAGLGLLAAARTRRFGVKAQTT